MAIDSEIFKGDLAKAYIELLTERGTATQLANSIGKKSSFITEIKRGKPVNALHLKAVELVFGPQKVLDLLSLRKGPKKNVYSVTIFADPPRATKVIEKLAALEQNNQDAYAKVEGYIDAQMDNPSQKNAAVTSDVTKKTGT